MAERQERSGDKGIIRWSNSGKVGICRTKQQKNLGLKVGRFEEEGKRVR